MERNEIRINRKRHEKRLIAQENLVAKSKLKSLFKLTGSEKLTQLKIVCMHCDVDVWDYLVLPNLN